MIIKDEIIYTLYFTHNDTAYTSYACYLHLQKYECHDIAEILLKLALNTNQSIKNMKEKGDVFKVTKLREIPLLYCMQMYICT